VRSVGAWSLTTQPSSGLGERAGRGRTVARISIGRMCVLTLWYVPTRSTPNAPSENAVKSAWAANNRAMTASAVPAGVDSRRLDERHWPYTVPVDR